MSQMDRRIIEELKTRILERVILHKMILFGSRARGDADPDSDMDVLVILEGPAAEKTRDFVRDCAWEAGYRDGIVVVPIVFGRDEWENGPERASLLAQAVAAEGIPV